MQAETPATEIAPDKTLPAHRPFRAWALQHDLISLLGGGDWRPGVDADESESAGSSALAGQAHLTQALAPDARLELRTRISLLLWGSALVTDVLNQVIPSELGMPDGAFWLTVGGVVAAIAFTAIVYPRLEERLFNIVEQTMLGFACLLIVYQCSVTGGADSPYALWFLLVALYVGYLLPPARAAWNATVYGLLVVGTLFLSQSVDSDVTRLTVATLVIVLGVIAAALIRERRATLVLDRTVKFLALADPLTGVANLRALEQFLDRIARRDGQRFAVVMIDMNGLKAANAVFGHETGDGMIIRLSRLLLESSDADAQVARIGGDEFAIVLPRDPDDALELWRRRFEEAVEAHNISVRGKLPRISVSVGSAIYPDDGLGPRELLDVADRRMYEQKESAVIPPYELEGEVPGDPGHALRAARFADAPTRVFDKHDRARLGTINWVALGVLTAASAIVDPPGGRPSLAIGCAVYAFFFAALCEYGRAQRMPLALSIVIDIATVFYLIPAIIFTGGAESPILAAAVLPLAYYAQHFSTRFAAPRIVAVIGLFTATFWSYNTVPKLSLTLFGVLLAVMLIMAVVMQLSSRAQSDSLVRIRESATHDPLTRLPNEYALRSDLAKAIRAVTNTDNSPVLVLADLEDFRRVNTLAGHRGGDTALCSVADQLEELFAASAYRVGGDEFAVLSSTALDTAAIDDLVGNCRRAMALTIPNGPGDEIHLLGDVTSVVHIEGQSADQMIESAEETLRAIKAERKTGESPGKVLL